LNFIHDPEYMQHCRNVCKKGRLGRINTLIEGDVDFLSHFLNVLEGLEQLK